MKRTLGLLALGASAFISLSAWAQADVSLWRIFGCGERYQLTQRR